MNFPVVTVFCAFTRTYHVKRFFDDLASTDLKAENTNLALIIDCGENIQTGEHDGAKIYARIMAEMNLTNYRKFLILRNFEHHVDEVSISVRRKRIAEIKNQSKDLIKALDGEYVLSLEDDTVFTNLCVQRLAAPFWWAENTPDFTGERKPVGLVSAYEAGRWYNKIIGIWNFDNVDDPQQCWTLLPGKDYEEVDAAGFYCYLTPRKLYLEHEYDTDIIDPYGPDVRYGLWLRQQGYNNYVDWSQPCGHADGDLIITPNDNLYVEQFTKQDVWVRK